MSGETRLEVLFRENYHALVFFAFRLLGSSRIEAEDIVQDAFVKYWNQRAQVSEDPLAVKSYLYTSVRNACLNVVRHKDVALRYEMENRGEVPVERSILEHLLEAETMAIVHKAMALLPPVCRQVARMSHLEGKKNEEIASELGISVNSVKTHKQRAIKLLRRHLDPEVLILLAPLLH